jgi:twitching motility protein PilT
VQNLATLFDELSKRGGSDLHLVAGYPPLGRVRGELGALSATSLEPAALESALLALLSAPLRARLEADLELDFSHEHEGSGRYRVRYVRSSAGLAAVFRLVPRVLTLAELACPEVLWRLADRRGGLVLVTGPSVSGRTTTIAAMVDHINKTRACHVLTIEEPIEFLHEPLRAQITSREVGTHAPSFASALRSAARENPDVVVVSALGTAESVRLTLQLAGQGVLVLAVLDTNGATPTLERLVSRFPADEQAAIRSLLADVFAGLVSQQLVPTLDAKGRAPVHEILLGSSAVSTLIREGKTAQLLNVMQAGQAQGMQTLDAALERLLAQGRISADVAIERAVDREAFAQAVARVRPDLAELLG